VRARGIDRTASTLKIAKGLEARIVADDNEAAISGFFTAEPFVDGDTDDLEAMVIAAIDIVATGLPKEQVRLSPLGLVVGSPIERVGNVGESVPSQLRSDLAPEAIVTRFDFGEVVPG
jgi:hypothetical protein